MTASKVCLDRRKATKYAWQNIIQRCNNKNHPSYHYYGGRGIFICDRWLNSFESFLEDMGEVPVNHTIERIDVNKGYEPGNCRWATMRDQNRNRRDNILITYNGKTQCLQDWALELGVDESTLNYRVKSWGIERAFSEPIGAYATHSFNAQKITYQGKTQSIVDWAKEIGMHYTTIHTRLKRGWSVERALNTPARSRKQHFQHPAG